MHVNNSFYKYNNNSSAFSQVRPNYLYIITIFFKYRWGLSYLLKLMPFSIMPSSIFISSFTFHPYTIFGSNDYYH